MIKFRTLNARKRNATTQHVRRVSVIVFGFLMSGCLVCMPGGLATASDQFIFTIIKGKAQPVCDAYQRRLNTTRFSKPPYCGIPEINSSLGFSKLNRVMLSPDEVVKLWSRIFWFVEAQDQFATSSQAPAEEARNLVGTDILAWRYQPQISLGNDGRTDNVLIWQGFGVDTTKAECGSDVFLLSELYPFHSTQLGFILTPDNQKIDEIRTREIFGRASANAVRGHSTTSVERKRFYEVGTSVGIFEYGGMFYISTFYDKGVGDLYGKRKDQDVLTDTLAVILHNKGKTTLACEYRLNTEVPHAKRN